MAGRRDEDDELAEEMQFHREQLEREHGVDEARRRFGNELAARQYARDARIAPWLQEIAQDIRFGGRVLRRERGFAVTAILVLGLGIGVNNMLFTILHAHTIRGLPIERADRVLYISSFDRQIAERGLSVPELQELRAHTTRFAGIAAYLPAAVAVGDAARAPDRVDAAYVTANAFSVLGVAPLAGRTFHHDDDRRGAAPVAVLGSGVWESRYAADRAILGRTILVNGAPVTVIGVMPPRSGFPSTADLWLPLAALPGIEQHGRDARVLRVFARLRDDAREEDARAEVAAIVARLAQESPETSRGSQARVVPINQPHLGRLTDLAWIAFMGFGCLALLLACANVANLMLAHALGRAREIAVRTSLGATRRRVVRQLLIESTVIAAAGSVIGVAVSLAGVRLFASAIPSNAMPYWFAYEMNGAVLATLAAAAFATVLVFGLAPALQASRADVNDLLRGGGRGVVPAAASRRWMAGFTALQLGVTVMMLAYLISDFQTPANDLASDAVIESTDVVTGNVTLPADRYGTPELRRAFFQRLQEGVAAIPTVSAVTVASLAPRRGAVPRKVEVEAKPLGLGVEAPTIGTVSIGPRFFATLGLAMERGREFTAEDGRAGSASALVSTRFVELFLPDRDPIGSRVRFAAANREAEPPPWLTIVGVAPQVHHRSAQEAVAYLPFDAAPPATATVLLRAGGERTAMRDHLRETLRQLDPHLPVYRILTMAEVVQEQAWVGRVASGTVRSIATLAFLLCVVGLYAVTAHGVAQRRSEIGLRMALGARPADVVRLVVRRAALHVALGLSLGIPGAIAWGVAFETGPPDAGYAHPSVLVPIVGLLAAATLVACWFPARQAARLDPVAALRSD